MLRLLLSLLTAAVLEVNAIRWGEDASSSTAPWMVLLQIKDAWDRDLCGGAILDNSWIITTAQCTISTMQEKARHPTDFKVIVGEIHLEQESGDEQERRIDMIFTHPNFDMLSNTHDIALMHLELPLNLDDTVAAIAIGDSSPSQGDKVLVTGFGETHIDNFPPKLKYIEQEVPSIINCRTSFPEKIDDTMWCSGNNEMKYKPSSEDEGGPVVRVVKDVPYLVGLVSWSVEPNQARKHFTVNNKVTAFKSWINGVKEDGYSTVLEVTDVVQLWSWSNRRDAFLSRYIKLSCDTPSCRIQIRSLSLKLGGGKAFHMTMFDGWSMFEDDAEKTPFKTITEENYNRIYATAGYASEGDKMLIVILLGPDKVDVDVTFSYNTLDDSLCEDSTRECDGVNDCIDLSDEIGCEYADNTKDLTPFGAGCYSSDFECGGYCIRMKGVCDGYTDCVDGVDEKEPHCAAVPISVPFFVFFSAVIALVVEN